MAETIQAVLAMWLQKQMSGEKSTADPAKQAQAYVDSVAVMASGMGGAISNLLGPLADIQRDAKSELMQEMRTITATGGRLPWDKDDDVPTPPTPSRADPVAARGNGSASAVARRISLTAPRV